MFKWNTSEFKAITPKTERKILLHLCDTSMSQNTERLSSSDTPTPTQTEHWTAMWLAKLFGLWKERCVCCFANGQKHVQNSCKSLQFHQIAVCSQKVGCLYWSILPPSIQLHCSLRWHFPVETPWERVTLSVGTNEISFWLNSIYGLGPQSNNIFLRWKIGIL